MITAYHYSTGHIASGDIITSNQHTQASYNLVWNLYREVADSIGIVLPREYGYAYPKPRHHFETEGNNPRWRLFVVEAPQDSVIIGNLHYSVYKTMAELGGYVDRSIKSLTERLAKRDAQVRKAAKLYFTELSEPDNIELISGNWLVK